MNRYPHIRYAAVVAACLFTGTSCNRATKPQAAPPTAIHSADAPVVIPLTAGAPPAATVQPATAPASTQASEDDVARIRDEGLNRSQVMRTLSYLSDVIGPRLTGSPNLRRANEWTRQQFSSWGLANAHLEAWGPFGRGWSLRRFSAQIVEPQAIPLIGYPKAWSPGFKEPVTLEVAYVDTSTDLQQYKGKLRGKAVLSGAPRDLQARFEPLATRVTDADLLQLANSDGRARDAAPGRERSLTPSERQAVLAATPLGRARGRRGEGSATSPTTEPTTGPATAPATRASPARVLQFLFDEGAAVVLTPSGQGDGGTYFIGAASLPGVDERRPGAAAPRDPDDPRNAATQPSATHPATDESRPASRTRPRPWQADAPPTLPQVLLATEHYNRLVRMIGQGEKLTLSLDLQVQFHDDDPMAYNTVAEIPGSDLADQVVMLGAHMDSWHSGTGATDNGAGCAAVMEAVRILRALDLRPRRTVRVALWTGEEQGLFGSKAYVAEHFGSFPEEAAADGRGPTTRPATGPDSPPARVLTKKPEYDKLAAYFNLDNGTGKVRGVYMQNNEGVRPIFRKWLAPFADLGASTLSLSGTGGTDHVHFDAIGLPGFQFIQDPVEYWTRTHHSNMDVYERAQADDLKQAAVILAAFVYDAAMADEPLPRKPVR